MIGYAVINFFYWFTYGAVINFASVYLLGNGFTNTQIGMLCAAAYVVSVMVQPGVAGYADKPHSPSLKVIILGFGTGLMLLGVFLGLTFQKSMALTGVFYGGAVVITQVLTPFVNALGTESARQGRKVNFSAARGVGSLGYAALCYIMGMVVDRYGPGMQPVCMVVIVAGLLASVLVYPFKKAAKDQEEKAESGLGSGSPIVFFRKYKTFGIALLGCIFVYTSHIYLNNFTYQIVVTKGGGSSEMGTAMAIASMVELPTMFLFVYMLRKASSVFWFRICGVFFTLKALGSLLAANMTGFYAVQIFQMFGWGLITVASVYYVDSIMQPEDKIKGQTYMTMSCTIASVIGSLTGGALIDWCGVNGMLLTSTAAGLLGTVIMLLATKEESGRGKKQVA